MPFLLLKRPATIPAWGLHDGMQFTVNEKDERLLSLFLYTSRKRGRPWTAIPRYKKEQRQPHENTLIMVFEQYGQRISWSIQHNVSVNPYNATVVDCQTIDTVGIIFDKIGVGLFMASVSYMTCTSTLEGFYYVKMLDWYTRCSSEQECVALFDAIERGLGKIWAELLKSRMCLVTIDHLSSEIVREHDPIRRASMQRKMQMMEQDADSVQCIVI